MNDSHFIRFELPHELPPNFFVSPIQFRGLAQIVMDSDLGNRKGGPETATHLDGVGVVTSSTYRFVSGPFGQQIL